MNETSRDWVIERNKLIHNKKAIRIAANQDHGIRGLGGKPLPVLPNNHTICNNEIRGNIIGVELDQVSHTLIDQNMLDNLIADLDEK